MAGTKDPDKGQIVRTPNKQARDNKSIWQRGGEAVEVAKQWLGNTKEEFQTGSRLQQLKQEDPLLTDEEALKIVHEENQAARKAQKEQEEAKERMKKLDEQIDVEKNKSARMGTGPYSKAAPDPEKTLPKEQGELKGAELKQAAEDAKGAVEVKDTGTKEENEKASIENLQRNLSKYKDVTKMDEDEAVKTRKYAQNVGKSLFARYKRGDFDNQNIDDPEERAKDAKKTFANLLVNQIGTTLYNIGSIWAKDNARMTSDFEKIKESDLEGAIKRKEKADEQSLEKFLRDQEYSEEKAKEITDGILALEKDEVWGPYMAKFNNEQKKLAYQLEADYGQFLKDNPELRGYVIGAVTDGNPQYLLDTMIQFDTANASKDMRTWEQKLDRYSQLFGLEFDKKKLRDLKLADKLGDLDVLREIGVDNLVWATDRMRDATYGTFGNRLKYNIQDIANPQTLLSVLGSIFGLMGK